MKNYYKVLGVPQTASAGEIKKAYEMLAKQYDPSQNRGDKYAEERFIDISLAYKTLIDVEKRKDYDKVLSGIQSDPGNDGKADGVSASGGEKRINPSVIYIVLALLAVVVTIFIVVKTHKKKEKRETEVVATDTATTPQTPVVNDQPAVVGVTPAETKVIKLDTPVRKEEKIVKKDTARKVKPAVAEKPIVKKDTVKIEPKTEPEPEKPVMSGLYIGATKSQVLSVQGTPTSIVKYENKSEMWYYGKSSIYFAGNTMSAYKNVDNNLKLMQSN